MILSLPLVQFLLVQFRFGVFGGRFLEYIIFKLRPYAFSFSFPSLWRLLAMCKGLDGFHVYWATEALVTRNVVIRRGLHLSRTDGLRILNFTIVESIRDNECDSTDGIPLAELGYDPYLPFKVTSTAP